MSKSIKLSLSLKSAPGKKICGRPRTAAKSKQNTNKIFILFESLIKFFSTTAFSAISATKKSFSLFTTPKPERNYDITVNMLKDLNNFFMSFVRILPLYTEMHGKLAYGLDVNMMCGLEF